MVKIVVIDLETTGLDSEKHSIIEIGAILTDESLRSIDEFSTYVRPRDGAEVSQEAMKVNQIELDSWSFKATALPPFHALISFDHWLGLGEEKGYLAGWNPFFDAKFLKFYFDKYFTTPYWPFHHRMLDIQSVNAFVNNFSFTSLETTMGRQEHRALHDAQLALARLKDLRAMLMPVQGTASTSSRGDR